MLTEELDTEELREFQCLKSNFRAENREAEKGRSLSISHKILMIDSIPATTVLYDFETWVLNRTEG